MSVFNHELIVSATVDELEGLVEWVDEILEKEACMMKAHSQIAIVLEEIFINIARYAYSGLVGNVRIRLGFEGPQMIMQFEDSGKAFNPLEYLALDTKAGIEQRRIGGMGIHIVRKMMDKVSYTRVDDKNVFTIHKTIRNV
ncbi:MAG: ATP-binding protein [Treponema sp.]|jgi:anti-sigma regulatory factor (Ser/Thr protein kinase)|nr:ATP-binding protein [Treponema sp.]